MLVWTELIARDLPQEGKDKTVAIIDIGTNFIHLFVLHSMHVVFAREEKFGGMQLIHAIADHYQMSPEQALAAKDQGTLPEDYDTAVMEPFKESVLLQIKRTLQFFYSTSQHGTVDHILLAGGLANLKGLASLIQEQLGVTTTVANPFAHMTISKMVNLEELTNDAPALMVACDLALRHIGWHYDNN